MRFAISVLPALAACTPVPVSPERAAEICEHRARDAQGPTSDVTIGANSNTGLFGSLVIGLSSDFIAGHDPVVVYEECVFDHTGSAPIRAPLLH